MMKGLLRAVAESPELTLEFKRELFHVLTKYNVPGKAWPIYHNFLQNARRTLGEIKNALQDEPGALRKIADLECLVKKLMHKGRRAINAMRVSS
jgi:hypothetical protein